MTIDAPKPIQMPSIDYADHTVEIDTRCFLAVIPKREARMNASGQGMDHKDPAADDELNATQVNELLTQLK